MRYFSLTALSLLFALSACVYEPEQFVESEKGGKTSNNSTTDMGALYAVNDGKQICNPSVSQDSKNYPASMLWLNFGGTLKVKAPDSVYTTSKVVQHDRLSVSDTSGKVLWYLMRDTEAGDCQFQDPEWSTHPNYIVALRAFNSKGESGCKESDMDYGMFAVRMSDKKKFFFYDKEMSEFATPHLWVETDAERDTTAADTTVEGFFGTLYSYAYQIKDVKRFALCLADIWLDMADETAIHHLANEGYPKHMCLAVDYLSNRSDNRFGLDVIFDTAELLPDLFIDDKPSSYIVTPVFCESECFGEMIL